MDYIGTIMFMVPIFIMTYIGAKNMCVLLKIVKYSFIAALPITIIIFWYDLINQNNSQLRYSFLLTFNLLFIFIIIWLDKRNQRVKRNLFQRDAFARGNPKGLLISFISVSYVLFFYLLARMVNKFINFYY